MFGRTEISRDSKKMEHTKRNKELKVVGRHDHPCSEGTWHIEEEEHCIFTFFNNLLRILEIEQLNSNKQSLSHHLEIIFKNSLRRVLLPCLTKTTFITYSKNELKLLSKSFSFEHNDLIRSHSLCR